MRVKPVVDRDFRLDTAWLRNNRFASVFIPKRPSDHLSRQEHKMSPRGTEGVKGEKDRIVLFFIYDAAKRTKIALK